MSYVVTGSTIRKDGTAIAYALIDQTPAITELVNAANGVHPDGTYMVTLTAEEVIQLSNATYALPSSSGIAELRSRFDVLRSVATTGLGG